MSDITASAAMMRRGNRSAFHSWKRAWVRSLRKYWQLYLLLIPVVVYYIMFKYVPMAGVQIAFKEFSFRKGIWGSAWVGLEHFERFFSSKKSFEIIWNTLSLSVMSMLITFPLPIALALLFNELHNQKLKKVVQTITYAPHFVSTVVVVGMMFAMCSLTTGVVNKIIVACGISDTPLYLMGYAKYFRMMYIISDIWKNTGWSAIIFVSALAAIDPTLYEAARVDGANRVKQLIHVTLPSILPTVVIMLILKSGNVLSIGFEKAYAMQTDLNKSVSEVISTYTYKQGINDMEYDYATAIGLMESVVSFILLVLVNYASRKLSETSLW